MLRWLACSLVACAASCRTPEPAPETAPEPEALPAPSKGPNLLLIDLDTMRADRLGATRNGIPVTPNLNALAKEGTRFETMIAQSGWTMPSVASLLTGRYPASALSPMPVDEVMWITEETRTVAEILQLYGYETAAFWGSTLPSQAPHFSRGFKTVQTPPRHINASQSATGVIEWLETEPAEPWFAMVHPFDLHVMGATPQEPLHLFAAKEHPDPYLELVEPGYYVEVLKSWTDALGPKAAQELLKAHYDGALHYQDAQIGQILAALAERGLKERTVVIFTSNHGEEWFEHGVFNHGPPYDFNLRVPLIVVIPGLENPPRTISTMVQTIDIAPTLLELAQVKVDAQMVGSSLLPLLHEEDGYKQQPAFSITDGVRLSLRTEHHKLLMCGMVGCGWIKPKDVRTPIYEFYDLRSDPLELRNLVPEQPPEFKPLKRALTQFIVRFGPTGPNPAARLTREQREAIRARGYWGSREPEMPRE